MPPEYGPFQTFRRPGGNGRSAQVYHDSYCANGVRIDNPVAVNPEEREDLDLCSLCADEDYQQSGDGCRTRYKLLAMDPEEVPKA